MHLQKSSCVALLALALIAISPGLQASNAQQETDLAAKAYQAGDYKTAAAHFQQVVKLDPNNIKAWLFLGQTQAKLNDNMGARRAFAKVLALQSSGPVADRAIEQLSKLPEPDLFSLQLDSGLTLGDWLPIAQQQVSQGKRDEVVRELKQHINHFGPVPQLLALQEKLITEMQAEREQRMQGEIAAIKVTDAATANTALPQIRKLKQQVPNSLALLQLEARACHLLKDFNCAQAAYAAWLKTASSNDPARKGMVEKLLMAKNNQPLPLRKYLPSIPSDVIDTESLQILENSQAFQSWPEPKYPFFNFHVKSTEGNTDSEQFCKTELPSGGIYHAKYKMIFIKDGKGPVENHLDRYDFVMVVHGVKMYNGFGHINDKTNPTFSGRYDRAEKVKIKSISGSIFPLAIGSVMEGEFEKIIGDRVSEEKIACRTMERINANSLNERFTGDAYRVECTEFTSGEANWMEVHYFNADGEIFGWSGKVDFGAKPARSEVKFPKAGTVIEQNAGSRSTQKVLMVETNFGN